MKLWLESPSAGKGRSVNFFKSLTLTFAMYSKIPMPRVEWDEKSMQWVFACFPLVGVVIGCLQAAWLKMAIFFNVAPILTAVVAMLLPIVLSGAIHLDGLCDVSDALGSNLPRERKLEIMKDPHIGAFGVIGCILYLIFLTACWCSVDLCPETIAFLSVIPVCSRSWVSLAAVTRKNARKSGLLATFTDAAAGKWNVVAAALWLTGSLAFFLTHGWIGCWIAGSSALLSAYFYRMSQHQFGGITGDLAGWYLQMLELTMIFALALTGGV